MLKIGVIVFPLPNATDRSAPGLSALITILSNLANKVLIISGNLKIRFDQGNVIVINVKTPTAKGNPEAVWSKIIRFFISQFTLSLKIIQLRGKLDIIIFHGSIGLIILPCLAARLFKIKIILLNIGSDAKSLEAMYPGLTGWTFSALIRLMYHLNCFLAAKIVFDSKSVIGDMGFQMCSNKISIARKNFIDFNKFMIEKPLSARDDLVGYIGRLGEEKGIINFIEAIPKVLKIRKVAFLVGGDGQLKDKVKHYLNEQGLNDNVNFVGYIPHDELSKYLNALKLLVLPSYTEGLPYIMVEAMACGTPFLATPVGAIPDIIKDGETGFIMINNSPEHIARNIIRALNHPKIEKVAQNAHSLVEREFNYNKIEEGWKKVIYS